MDALAAYRPGASELRIAEKTRDRLALLTPREHQVLRHILAGRTNKAIGDELGISKRTAEVHRHRILGKLDAENTACLVRIVTLAVT